MPTDKLETISEIEKLLAGLKKPRKAAPIPSEPKELTGLQERLAKGQTAVFTTELAKAAGMEIDFPEDWLMKVTPGKNGDESTLSYRSPEGVEFKPEDIYTREGEWLSSAELEEIRSGQFQAYIAETDEFQAVTKAFYEAREAAGLTPQELREIASGEFLVKDFDTGEFVPTTEAGVARREEYYRVKGRQAELASLFESVVPRFFSPFTEEQKPDIAIALLNMLAESDDAKEQFFETVQTQGRTPETERLLQILLPELTEEDLTEFFGVTTAIDFFGYKITLKRPDWWTLDYWLESFFKPYGGTDLKGKAAASFIAGIGDVISTTGAAARWLGFEDVGKVLSEIGAPLQRLAPPDTSGEFEIADLLDPEFYATKITRTIPFALSLAPLAIGGFYGGGAIATAVGIGRIGSWIVGGLAGAALSRPAESALEAGGAYDDAIARGKTEAEARKEADEVFRNNMVLAGADAWEIAIALAPTPKWVPTALVKGGLVRTARVAGKMVIVGLSEGGEELYQDMITRRARGEDWQLDPIAKEVFAIGMVMGMGMGLGGDVISSIVNRSKDKMTPEIKQDFDTAVTDFKARGFTDEQAELRALDTIAEIPEGEQIIQESIKEAKVEEEAAEPITEPTEPGVTPVEPVTPEVKVGGVEEYVNTGIIRELGTQNQYLLRSPYYSQRLDIMKRSNYGRLPLSKADKAIILKDEHWELSQVLVDKPAFLNLTGLEIALSDDEVRNFAIEHNLLYGRRSSGELVVAKDGTTLNRVLSAKGERELGLALGYKDIGVAIPKAEVPPVTPEVTPTEAPIEEVARPEPGMPEAGIQPTMIPEVLVKEVRPKGKGRVVQISMEDQLKLEQARRAAEEAPAEERVAYEAQAELEGLKATLEVDPVAQHRVQIKGKKVGLDFFIALREQTFPEYFTVKQAQALYPGKSFSKYNQPGLPSYNRVPKDEALDQLTKEFNMSPDEIADRVMAIRQEKRRIKAIEQEIQVQFAEKPLPVLPEPTPAEVAISPTGKQMLTPAQRVRTLELFGKYVESQSVIDAWQLTRELRRETRAGRAEELKDRAQELIVSKGIPAEEAMNQAIRETMAGELPTATTDYMSDLTEQMRETLFDKVYQTLKDEPFEMMSTAEALTNALLGRAIPREPGVKGGSAFTRLQRVFGDQPKVLKALDTIAKEGKSLEDIVEGIFRETGGPFIPVDQKMADYLRGLSSDVIFTPTEFREPELVTKYEAPIEDAIKQVPMWPTPVRDNIIHVLKEIGWAPVDIGNFIRANKASFDMSYWRQQGPLILNHPVSFVQSNVEAWKALFSQKAAEASWERISRDPLYELYAIAEEAGYDFLRPLEIKKGTSQWRGVEEFGYITGERLIPKLTGKIPHVKLSARAFVTGTNEHNWRIYKNHYAAMLRLNEKYASGELKLKPGQAFSIEKEMVDMARMLADFTQRASLGRVSGIIPALNSLIFAPRATLGRFLTPRHLVSANPRIRMEAWRDLTTFVAGIGGIVLLGNMLGLWEVEKDPRNAEYMSIRVGNIRVDPFSGYRQFLVFYTRVITGTGLSSVTGAEYTVNPLMAMTSFVRGKAAPLASILLDFWVGKNFVGEEVDVANKRQWVERIAPFSLWDIYESYMHDPAIALKVAIPAIVGMGVQAYTGDWVDNWTKMGLPKYSDNLVYGLTEPKYDSADFWSDTSSQFAGVDPTTLTKEKGFPPYIKAIAEARIINEHLRTLPNEKLVSLNADPLKDEGKTFAVYYQQWKDREKLVRDGDEEALKAFDQDERTRNAERGNFSQRQFALLNEYWAITDKEKQTEFLEEHKDDIGVNPRQDWLRSHPKENAQLAVWGQTKVLTLEAYTEFKRLLKELDIPDKAIPELTLPPEGSVDNYFMYLEQGEDLGYNSWEVQLIIAQDDDLREFLGREPIDTPVGSLALKIKHHSLFEQYDTLETDEDRAKLKADNPAWVDDMRRIEAIENVASAETIEAWVDRGKVTDEFTAGSSEAKVWLLDNPTVHKWALDQGLLTDDGSDWNENVLRLNVEMSKLDEESEEFKQFEIKKRAYQTVPEGMVDQYVEYYNLPEAGYRRERYLIENPEFTNEVGLKMPGAIPSVKYDEITEKWQADFERMAGLSDNKSEHYIVDPDERALEREAMRFGPDGKLTDFGTAEIRKKGYGLFVSEKYIDRFVEFDSLRTEGKPPDYPESVRYYEDEWYLFDHPLYYKDIYRGLLGLDEVNFTNVPTPDQRRVYTKKVFGLYATLKGLPQGNARREFEAENPDLDLFMHIEFGTMLESERAKVEAEKEVVEPVEEKEGETARERMLRELAEMEERLKR